jgi:hypothetical protein
MPEIISILTDDMGNITHLIDEDEARLTVAELAELLNEEKDYYVTFGSDRHYSITMVAEEGQLQPTVDDPEGQYSIRDLPQEQDPEEKEIDEMFGEMNRMGEFDVEGMDNTEQSDDTI